jgi:hypothetical protein
MDGRTDGRTDGQSDKSTHWAAVAAKKHFCMIFVLLDNIVLSSLMLNKLNFYIFTHFISNTDDVHY